MKKAIIGIMMLFFVSGCSLLMNNPKDIVRDYLDKYVDNDDAIKNDIDTFLNNSTYSEEQKKIYRDIVLKQYSNIKYTITKETIDKDIATVETNITVYDNYMSQKDSDLYLASHPDEFNTNGVYDETKFITYRLNAMKENTKTIDYTITFSLKKENDKWVLNQPSNLTLEKIHGIYNYQS